MMQKLLADLASTGFDVASVSELRTSGTPYPKAVPVLLKWLPKVETASDKEEIVRALSVPWARSEALGPLIEEFKAVPHSSSPEGDLLRWAIGNAIEVLWDDARFLDLVDLAQQRSYGRAREMVVLGLGRSKRPEAGDVLIELLDDPDVNGHAVKALAKLRLPKARPGLEKMLGDDRAWVRRAAKKALENLRP
ncbi:MAG: HEAT repeat domain-containing protein [Dermatophilaceae bacterium]